MPGTVSEVSATLVAITTRRHPSGGGANTRAYTKEDLQSASSHLECRRGAVQQSCRLSSNKCAYLHLGRKVCIERQNLQVPAATGRHLANALIHLFHTLVDLVLASHKDEDIPRVGPTVQIDADVHHLLHVQQPQSRKQLATD
eukprot:534646-Prorocentrum_minimum.AAC.5